MSIGDQEHAFQLNVEELSWRNLASQKEHSKGRYSDFAAGYVVQRVAALDVLI